MTLMVFILTVFVVVAGQPHSATPSLQDRLRAYFETSDPKERIKLATGISDEFRFDDVCSEMPNLDLWPVSKGEQKAADQWTLKLPSGRSIAVQVSFPESHDRSIPKPLILDFGPHSTKPSGQILSRSLVCKECIWAVPDEPIGGEFHSDPNAAADLPFLLREIRRKTRIDSDRIYVLGQESRADSAWVAAIMYPREFAGLIAVSGIPQIPYPEQSYPLLLPNLRPVPFLSLWVVDPAIQPPSRVAAVNQVIADFAVSAGMSFDSVTLAAASSEEFSIPKRMMDAVVSKARAKPNDVAHWFRFLPQGNLGWLRATELGGPVWHEDQISIVSTSDADRSDFISSTLKEKLFSLSGRIEGQKIIIETHRLEGIELQLSSAYVKLDEPVTIEINGRVRFEGLLKTSVIDLLGSAYEDWDFQNLVHVRKQFSIQSK